MRTKLNPVAQVPTMQLQPAAHGPPLILPASVLLTSGAQTPGKDPAPGLFPRQKICSRKDELGKRQRRSKEEKKDKSKGRIVLIEKEEKQSRGRS
jgi:hypothetical protein